MKVALCDTEFIHLGENHIQHGAISNLSAGNLFFQHCFPGHVPLYSHCILLSTLHLYM